MKLDLNNAIVTGLGDSDIKHVKADLDKRTIEAEAYVKLSTITADYVMDGKFLVLPAKGKGKSTQTFTGLRATIILKAEPKTKSGKTYWDVQKVSVDIKGMENFKVNFENMFNGDKALGDNTNKILNKNWKEFWGELKPAFEETFEEVFLQLSKLIFSKVPESEIFLE